MMTCSNVALRAVLVCLTPILCCFVDVNLPKKGLLSTSQHKSGHFRALLFMSCCQRYLESLAHMNYHFVSIKLFL